MKGITIILVQHPNKLTGWYFKCIFCVKRSECRVEPWTCQRSIHFTVKNSNVKFKIFAINTVVTSKSTHVKKANIKMNNSYDQY